MSSRFDHRFDMGVSDTADGGVKIEVNGDVDRSSVTAFERAVLDRMAHRSSVVADVSGASMIDSAALAALVRLHETARDHDVRFEVEVGFGFQRRLFDVAGLSDHVNLVTKGEPAPL